MTHDAVLNQLGLIPNEALLVQLENIQKNTRGYVRVYLLNHLGISMK